MTEQETQIQRAVQFASQGLATDGAHHKQYYLEQVLVVLKGSDWLERTFFDWVQQDGSGWVRGVRD